MSFEFCQICLHFFIINLSQSTQENVILTEQTNCVQNKSMLISNPWEDLSSTTIAKPFGDEISMRCHSRGIHGINDSGSS